VYKKLRISKIIIEGVTVQRDAGRSAGLSTGVFPRGGVGERGWGQGEGSRKKFSRGQKRERSPRITDCTHAPGRLKRSRHTNIGRKLVDIQSPAGTGARPRIACVDAPWNIESRAESSRDMYINRAALLSLSLGDCRHRRHPLSTTRYRKSHSRAVIRLRSKSRTGNIEKLRSRASNDKTLLRCVRCREATTSVIGRAESFETTISGSLFGARHNKITLMEKNNTQIKCFAKDLLSRHWKKAAPAH